MLRAVVLGVLGLWGIAVLAKPVPNVGLPPFEVTGGTPLQPLVRIKPIYPPEMQYRGNQACVNMAFTVGTDGRVSDIRVWTHYPRAVSLFDIASKNVLRGYLFVPHKVDGKPVMTKNVHQTFTFSISAKDARGEETAAAVSDTLTWLCDQPPLRGVSITIGTTEATAARSRASGAGYFDASDESVAAIPTGVLPTKVPPGRVRIRFCVDAEGRPADTIVDQSEPPGVYDAAARDALAATYFSARKIAGAAVMTCGLNLLASFNGNDVGTVGTIHDMAFDDITETSSLPKLEAQNPVAISLHIPAGTPLPKVAKVEVRMCIEKNGEVSGASVVHADPPDYFDQAALQTVAGWRFASPPRRMCDVYQSVEFPLGGGGQ